tara:strand:- start:744 stop:1073 length:330 start_codon:yes stop_codon:yes gene_type:complete
MSGPFKLKYNNSAFPFKSPLKKASFGPKVAKPITAEEASKTGKKRIDLVINAAKNWREKLTTPIKPKEHDDKMLSSWVIPNKKKQQEEIKEPGVEVGIPEVIFNVPDSE